MNGANQSEKMYPDGPCNQGQSPPQWTGQDWWYNRNIANQHIDREKTCIQMDHVTRFQAYPSGLDKICGTVGMVLTSAWVAENMYPEGPYNQGSSLSQDFSKEVETLMIFF